MSLPTISQVIYKSLVTFCQMEIMTCKFSLLWISIPCFSSLIYFNKREFFFLPFLQFYFLSQNDFMIFSSFFSFFFFPVKNNLITFVILLLLTSSHYLSQFIFNILIVFLPVFLKHVHFHRIIFFVIHLVSMAIL